MAETIPLSEQITALEKEVANRKKFEAMTDMLIGDDVDAETRAGAKSAIRKDNAALEAALETLKGLGGETDGRD